VRPIRKGRRHEASTACCVACCHDWSWAGYEAGRSPASQTETANSEETTAGIDQSSTERTDNTDREPNADAQTGSADRALTFSGHTGWIDGVSFSPDSQRLAIASSDQTAKVWDAATGQETLTLKEHDRGISSVSFSPDGKWLASASYDQTVKVWDVSRRVKISRRT